MRLTCNELPDALERGLAPLYLLSGTEPLLLEEAADRLRAAARKAEFSERALHVADARYNWSALKADARSRSLFASRRLVEVRLASGKPGAAGAKVLKELADSPPEDTLLMVIAGGLDRLALTNEPGPLGLEAVMGAIADASRFDVFQLGSAALGQDLRRTARILAGLKREGAPLTLILWVLVRDITTLADLHWRTARGDSLPSAMGALAVWSSRKAEFRAALKRHGARSIAGLLRGSARADQVVKGARTGEPWAELEQLAFALAEPHRMGGER